MNTDVPESHIDLLSDEKRALGMLATTMSDGTPQVTPVWFSMDGEFLCINTARGRVKDRNMTARPQVAIAISDPQDPYRCLQIRGRVDSVTEEGAREHIDTLATKYLGTPSYENYQGETRVKYFIRFNSVSTVG